MRKIIICTVGKALHSGKWAGNRPAQHYLHQECLARQQQLIGVSEHCLDHIQAVLASIQGSQVLIPANQWQTSDSSLQYLVTTLILGPISD